MKRYLNRTIVVTNLYDGSEHEFVRDVLVHKDVATVILGGESWEVEPIGNIHHTKAQKWTAHYVSRETIDIAKRARRHR